MKISFVGLCILGVLGLVGCQGADTAGESGSDVKFASENSTEKKGKCTLFAHKPLYKSESDARGDNSDKAIDWSDGGEVVSTETVRGSSTLMRITYKNKTGKSITGYMIGNFCDN
jgi:hypothetical protein